MDVSNILIIVIYANFLVSIMLQDTVICISNLS